MTIFPYVRIVRIRLTDLYRIFEVIRRMNYQVEVDNTVASCILSLTGVLVVSRYSQLTQRSIISREFIILLIRDMSCIPTLESVMNADDITYQGVATQRRRNGIVVRTALFDRISVHNKHITVTQGDIQLFVRSFAYDQVEGSNNA